MNVSSSSLSPISGVRLSAVEANIKNSGRLDLAFFVFDSACPVAGVQTRSLCAGAPVEWNKKTLSGSDSLVRGIVINSGNANAFTGSAGDSAARATARNPSLPIQ